MFRNWSSIKLYTDRIVAFKQVYEDLAEDLLNKHDPMAPLDEDIKPYLISKDQFLSAFENAKGQHKEQFLYMVRRLIWQTKLRRAPNTPIWREGRLPILLIGGGSKLQFFPFSS